LGSLDSKFGNTDGFAMQFLIAANNRSSSIRDESPDTESYSVFVVLKKLQFYLQRGLMCFTLVV
jgi:hypothetical protein